MNRRFVIAGAAAAAALSRASADASGLTLADRFASTLSGHDMEAFAALFSDNYINHQVSAAAPPSTVTPGKTQKQGVVELFSARLAGIPDLDVAVETQLHEADKFAASFVYSGTHGGTFYGVAPSGKLLRFTSCDIYRVENGLLAEHWGMGDLAGVLAQLHST